MYVLHGVSKVHSNVSKRRFTNSRPANTKMAYYISESGSLHTERKGKIKFYFLKFFVKKWSKRKFICEKCSYVFEALIQNKKDSVDCPNC